MLKDIDIAAFIFRIYNTFMFVNELIVSEANSWT